MNHMGVWLEVRILIQSHVHIVQNWATGCSLKTGIQMSLSTEHLTPATPSLEGVMQNFQHFWFRCGHCILAVHCLVSETGCLCLCLEPECLLGREWVVEDLVWKSCFCGSCLSRLRNILHLPWGLQGIHIGSEAGLMEHDICMSPEWDIEGVGGVPFSGHL